MKKIIIFSALLASSASWAQTPTSGGSVDESALDPNESICQPVARTGSRLSRARVCMTRAQWAEQRRVTRQNIERTQTSHVERQY
jgi:hypothetical protein